MGDVKIGSSWKKKKKKNGGKRIGTKWTDKSKTKSNVMSL